MTKPEFSGTIGTVLLNRVSRCSPIQEARAEIGQVVNFIVTFSEPGAVKAWWDNVHEYGTREYGSGSMKSGFRRLAISIFMSWSQEMESSRVEPRENHFKLSSLCLLIRHGGGGFFI